MKEIFTENGLNVSEEKIKKLEEFKNILLEYNEKFNLTSIKEEKEIYVKHFVDSLKGEKFFKKGASVLEVGSGGGFPSIPLMIIREDLKFTLVESTGKKCEYLKEAVRLLKTNNVEVICDRAEVLGKNEKYREKFDVVTARAVAKLNTLSEYCMPFIKVGGSFIAYKGESVEEEVKEGNNAIKILGGEIKEIYKYDLKVTQGSRGIVVIEKVKNTPEKYPRGQGKERSKPL